MSVPAAPLWVSGALACLPDFLEEEKAGVLGSHPVTHCFCALLLLEQDPGEGAASLRPAPQRKSRRTVGSSLLQERLEVPLLSGPGSHLSAPCAQSIPSV